MIKICEICYTLLPQNRKLANYIPKKFMEKNSNSFLKRISNRQKVGYVHVRVLYNKQKDVIVKKGMRDQVFGFTFSWKN